MATETESIPGTWTHQSREVKVPIGEDTDVLDQPPGYPAETIPAGFSRRRARVGTIGIDYVIGGSGPTLVLLHGYPQSWYEWRHIMPPDGYDKKTLAGDIHWVARANRTRQAHPAGWPRHRLDGRPRVRRSAFAGPRQTCTQRSVHSGYERVHVPRVDGRWSRALALRLLLAE